LISLDDLNEIVLEVTGDDFTKAQVLTPDGEQAGSLCQAASIHIRVGDMIRMEIRHICEVDGVIQAEGAETLVKSTWFTVDGASFRVKAWREREQPEPYKITHLPTLLADKFDISSSEGRRLLSQGGVKINDAVVNDLDVPTDSLEGATVQLGKRRQVEL
jgi:hypothetical protein